MITRVGRQCLLDYRVGGRLLSSLLLFVRITINIHELGSSIRTGRRITWRCRTFYFPEFERNSRAVSLRVTCGLKRVFMKRSPEPFNICSSGNNIKYRCCTSIIRIIIYLRYRDGDAAVVRINKKPQIVFDKYGSRRRPTVTAKENR